MILGEAVRTPYWGAATRLQIAVGYPLPRQECAWLAVMNRLWQHTNPSGEQGVCRARSATLISPACTRANFTADDKTMSARNTSLLTRSINAVWHPCTQMKQHETLPLLPIARAEGVWLYDFDGRRYLDAIS